MEKGLVKLARSGYASRHSTPLEWYSDKTIKKHEKFPKSLFLIKPDHVIFGTIQGFSFFSNLIAYRCENCGAILIIPPEYENKDI
ncbi:MAG: hypothetical protein J1E40_11350 [Oscillospiraceae bacterium]|nr:hypothetical protein [Oscillospiraceae bacterium]